MPYIPAADRNRIDTALDLLPDQMTAGEANYAITKIMDKFVQDHGLNYANLNAVAGVLACAGSEFYRRVTVPYENGKIRLNGDVYNCLAKAKRKKRAK